MAADTDRVQDGRHLMNAPEDGALVAARGIAAGLGWVGMGYGGTVDALARLAPNAASVAVLDAWLDTLPVSSPSRERTGEQPA